MPLLEHPPLDEWEKTINQEIASLNRENMSPDMFSHKFRSELKQIGSLCIIDGISSMVDAHDALEMFWNGRKASQEHPVTITSCETLGFAELKNGDVDIGGFDGWSCQLQIHESVDPEWFHRVEKPPNWTNVRKEKVRPKGKIRKVTKEIVERGGDFDKFTDLPDTIKQVTDNIESITVYKNALNSMRDQVYDVPFKEGDHVNLGIFFRFSDEFNPRSSDSHAVTEWITYACEQLEKPYTEFMSKLK